MKTKLIAMYLTMLGCLLSCTENLGNGETTPEDEVKIRFIYTLDTSNGSQMSKASTSNEDVFEEFYSKIKSGDLLATTYCLTLTNINNGTRYTFNGNWEDNTFITIRTGQYEVVGYSTAEGDAIQDRCSIIFNEQIDITAQSSVVALNGAYDCALIVFTDNNIESLLNFDGETSTSFFSFNTYKYAFVNNQLFTSSGKNEAYILGTYTNGDKFQINTGSLNFTKGKYYVYNNIGASFNVPPMEEGDETLNSDVVTINLPPNNEIWYTSATGEPIELDNYPYELISNTYENGIGKYKFNEDVVNIGAYFSDRENSQEDILKFTSLTLPSTIKNIDTYFALGYMHNASYLILPVNLASIGVDFIGGFGENLDEKHLYFLSTECPTYSGTYYGAFWNQSSTLYVHYPKGADYSTVETELEKWKNDSGDFEYQLVETSYNLIYKQ